MPQVSREVSGKPLALETGTLARQADGSILAGYGGNVLLATVVAGPPREGIDFFPLTVDYEERYYSAGKIPGSRFIKREGRPSERAILTCRLIDRPLRPLFFRQLRNDIQVIVITLSLDQENPPDVLGIVAASAAVSISQIPFQGPLGAVRVGKVNGEYIANPTYAQLAESELDLIVAGTREGVIMIEAGARQASEQTVAEGIEFGQQAMMPLIEMQEELQQLAGKPKLELEAPQTDPELAAALQEFLPLVRETLQNPDKLARESATEMMVKEVVLRLAERFSDQVSQLSPAVHAFVKEQFRQMILKEGHRPDGRQPDEIRPVSCQVGLLPSVHGSGLFTRGQTQVLSVLTLGGVGEAQLLDSLGDQETKRYMHHYNFPPYSVGEVRPMRGPSRRDIGHGALAERALLQVLPSEADFPYAIRIVSEVLESNGSSSMASVCGCTLALMDAGVPIAAPVAGVAMGMVSDAEKYVLLTDIQGIEDGSGDMDFKVAGTRQGITALQLDIKVGGLTHQMLTEALAQAREARLFLLDVMQNTLAAPRPHLAPHAPRIFTVEIHPDKIGDLIGPGGKVIKKLQADFNVRIDVEDDGRVFIYATDGPTGEAAKRAVDDITREVRMGETYVGKVVRIAPFGAFVELLPGRDGLVHISELARHRVERVEDVVQMGDEVVVKVINIDPQGKIRLTRKGALGEEEGRSAVPAAESSGPQDSSRQRR